MRPLQPLLFVQTVMLMGVGGVLAHAHLGAGLTVCALLVWCDSRAWKNARLILLGVSALAGYVSAWFYVAVFLPPVGAVVEHSGFVPAKVVVEGQVREVRGLPDQRLRVILSSVRTSLPDWDGADVAWTWDQPVLHPLPGQRVRVAVKLRPALGFRNAGLGDGSLYWRLQGVTHTAWTFADKGEPPQVFGQGDLSAVWRENLKQRLVEILFKLYGESTVAWGVLPALLFGDRFWLRSSDMELFNHASLSHSLALSGQHLAVMGLFALLLIAGPALLRPTLFLRVPRFKLVLVLSLPLAVLYLWLGSAPPSLVRSALMLGFWTFYCWQNRPAAFPDALVTALFCMVAYNPAALQDVGLQLSFAAVAGIALVSPILKEIWKDNAPEDDRLGEDTAGRHRYTVPLHPHLRGVTHLVTSTLVCSLAVQLATLPLVIHIFGRSSPWFMLNLLWLPVLGLWVLPLAFIGLLCVALHADALAEWILPLTVEPCRWLLDGLLWLHVHAGLDSWWYVRPHWTAMVGFACVLVLLALLPGRKGHCPRTEKSFWNVLEYRLAFAGMLLLLIGPTLRLAGALNLEIRLRVFDVGQAQAVLVEWPFQRRALVDGGGFRSDRFDSGRDVLTPTLSANTPLRLELVAFSHADTDHLRGLLFVVQHFKVGQAALAQTFSPNFGKRAVVKPLLLQAYETLLAQGEIPRRDWKAREVIPLGFGLALEVLAPLPGCVAQKNDGLILRLTHEGRGLALLPGDAEKKTLQAVLASGQDLRAEVLVLPHHGSDKNLCLPFLDAVSPVLALVSCGLNNPYGFPGPKVRAALAERGIPLRSTALEGELLVRWPGR